MTTPFIEENDQTRARREHLDSIGELVGNPYPNKFRRTNVAGSAEGEDTITAIVRAFKGHAPQTEAGARPSPEQLEEANAKLKEPGTVRVSGRIATPPRVMGKAAFVHLSDGRERLQIYVRKQDAVALSNDSGQPVEEQESGWALFQLLDHGDFVGVEGFLFITKTGELSIHVEKIQFLSKALLPMPDKLHGISDPEIRQRRRYADLIASSLKIEKDDEQTEGAEATARELTTREVFERRSKLITQMRRHLDDHGYIEVETPMLSPIASGAAARPFRTHHNALDIDLYLRIAPELYLKRLVVGGFERVYELNRNFRNEGISTRHNPEFTMLEFYCAYMDADGMMDFCEELLKKTIQTINGSLQVRFENEVIDFSKFERLTMKEAIARHWPKRVRNLGADEISASTFDNPTQVERAHWFLLKLNEGRDKLVESHRESAIEDYRQNKFSGQSYYSLFKTEEDFLESYDFNTAIQWYEEGRKDELWDQSQKRASRLEKEESITAEGTARQIVEMFEMLAESKLIQPTFIIDFPKPISPLSKASPDDPTIAERFELYIAGMECANGFSELNDPVEQYQRFEEQTRQRERGDDEAMQMDEDYVKALSYGMPPAAGIGIGIDRLTMLLTNRRSIRDVILFPHMRPQRHAGEDEAPPEGEPDA
ncbi:MAG TPA: lysine--tRNA ligase [Pyrinomonadaceae bacterium]|nr:lysine--tRNA ligase [Pyrinomonadaceae bacterium]